MNKTDFFNAAKAYYLEIEQDRKALLKLYPELEEKKYKMSDEGRKNISRGMRAFYRDKKAAEKKNGKDS